MKTLIKISLLGFIMTAASCEKTNSAPSNEAQTPEPVLENCGPYGKTSSWKSIGGDTLFAQNLTLKYFYTQQATPCKIYYYSQNYPFWNDYDYTLAVSGCKAVGDTLIIIDIDSNKKAIFKREE